MSLLAQIIIAELARTGAHMVLEDAALAPFAADLAGARGTYPDGRWRLTGLGGGLCRVVPPGVPALATVTCAVGAVQAPDAAFWFLPPPDARLSGWFALHPQVAEIMVRPPSGAASMRRLEQLQQFAEDLSTGAMDARDWVGEHLAGRCRLLRATLPVGNVEVFELDPLGTLAPTARADALRHAAAGYLRLDRAEPLPLRIPTFGNLETVARIVVEARGEVHLDTVAGGAPCAMTQPCQDVRAFDVTAAAGPSRYLDLSIRANAGKLVAVFVKMPVTAQRADEAEPDELDRYGDPLDAYHARDALA